MTLVMGILNVTPDSFSDGGQWLDTSAAVAHGVEMAQQGAGIIDVGGESTRPGAERVSADEEARRVLPVISELAARGIAVSVDTMRASVARQAVTAGARIVNDVSGGKADPQMFSTVAELGAEMVVMHWRNHSAQMYQQAVYQDVVAEVQRELLHQRDEALRAGIASEKIILDPGVGFAKNAEQNWQLVAALEHFQQLGHRILWGVSRKRFLSDALGERPAPERDVATAVISALAAQAGVWAVRTHEVQMQLDAIAVGGYLRRFTR